MPISDMIRWPGMALGRIALAQHSIDVSAMREAFA